ncbi:MAG: T9SS type A sorting domain-containing protein [Chitinophagaceae bacterium]
MIFTLQSGGPINLRAITPSDTLFYRYYATYYSSLVIMRNGYRTGMTKTWGDTVEIKDYVTFTSSTPENRAFFCVEGTVVHGNDYTDLTPDDNQMCGDIYFEQNATQVSSLGLLNEEIHIVPNPAQNQIHLQYAAIRTTSVVVVITDLTGRAISNFNYIAVAGDKKSPSIDISQLSTGMYIVEIQHDGVTSRRNFVKY